MAVRITLDSTLLTNTPIGWDDAKIKSKVDKAIKGLFVEYTTDLEFWGDGFDYIDSVMELGYCDTISVLIETNDCDESVWVEEFVGIIQITQLTEYDVDKRIIKTKILDESFDAKIDNNKSLKAFVDVPLSKNGDTIAACTPIGINFFLPTATYPTYMAGIRHGYRVYDCFRFIIDYMTDGNVDFVSDIFSTDYYDWMLFNGKEVRLGTGNGDDLEVSFKELFIELDKKTNLSFAIEPSSGYSQFQLRLEPTEYFEQDDEILTLDNVLGIMMSFNKEMLYSHVDIGSKDFDDYVLLSYPPINFKAFKEENYTILGQCNIDKGLNLVSNYVIDTNVIEKLLTTGSTDTKYDKKTFLVVTDGTNCIKYKEYDNPIAFGAITSVVANELNDTGNDFVAAGVLVGDMVVNVDDESISYVVAPITTNTLTLNDDIFTSINENYQIRTSPYSYNDPLTNINVINRFLGGLPNSVIKQYSVGATSNFRAGTTVPLSISIFPSTTNPVEFDDDSTPPFFDDGGNYNTTSFTYEIPTSGLYGFETNIPLRLNGMLDTTNLASTTSFYELIGDIWGMPSINHYRYFGVLQPRNIYVFSLIVRTTQNSVTLLNTGDIIPGGISAPVLHTFIIDYSQKTSLTTIESQLTLVFRNVPWNIHAYDFYDITLYKTPVFNIKTSFIRSDNAGSMLQTFFQNDKFIFNHLEYQRNVFVNYSKNFPTFSGEKISVKLEITTLSGSLMTANTINDEITDFKTILIDDGGGDILPVDPKTFPIYQYKFEKSIPYSKFLDMKNNPAKAILFSKNQSNHLFGFRNEIEYDRETGKCTFNLRSRTKINGDC